MRKLIIAFLLGALFLFPHFASAQSEVRLASLNVQLWPEYDQPSMLVIHDFTVEAGTQFPAKITFRFPAQANLIAVAVTENGNLVNTPFDGPTKSGDWQTITIAVPNVSVYRFEYYEPMSLNGNSRLFTYLWNGDYTVDAFSLRVQEPMDVTSLTGEPALTKTQDESGTVFYVGKTQKIDAGAQYTQTLKYEKTSDRLVVESQNVQTNPINTNTSGRPALTNYLPYALGILGIILVAGGLVYYFQSNRTQKAPRRRSHAQNDEVQGDEIYCHQCGTRARAGDRFCRTCGSKLRLTEE